MSLSIRNFGYADRQPIYAARAAKETMDTLMGKLSITQKLAVCQQIEENVYNGEEDDEVLFAIEDYLKRAGLWRKYLSKRPSTI